MVRKKSKTKIMINVLSIVTRDVIKHFNASLSGNISKVEKDRLKLG
jgi:hypothetical protein